MPAESEDTELLRAIVALMIDAREARLGQDQETRTEVLLANAGLPVSEIASLMGKQSGAVRMAISRAKRAKA